MPRLCIALALSSVLVACGGGDTPPPQSPPPQAAPGVLAGNIDVRPFQLHAAFALRRPDGKIDIKGFDRPVTPDIGCLSGEQGTVDTQRTVWIQMDWPVQQGSTWMATDGSQPSPPNRLGVSFLVRRGLGGTGQGAVGVVRIDEVRPDGGVLFLDVGTSNRVGGVHGTIKGNMPFTLCNG